MKLKTLLAICLSILLANPCLAIERNVSGQKLTLQAIDSATGRPKTGDAGQITAYESIDGDTTPDALADTSATELSSTNLPGVYQFDLSQAESNGASIVFGGKSSTSGIDIIPRQIWTVPANFGLAVIDSSGRLDISKVGGSATPVTNLTTVFSTDFTRNYDATNKLYRVRNMYAPRTIFVALTGNDSNPGTESLPYLTIQTAIDASPTTGTTIRIKDGDYTGQGALDLGSANGLTLEGESRTGVLTRQITTGNQNTIRRMTITAASSSSADPSGQGIYCQTKRDLVFEDCDINGYYDGLFGLGVNNVVVRGCKITGTYDAVNLQGGANILFENCWLYTDGTWTDINPTVNPSRGFVAAFNTKATLRDCRIEVRMGAAEAGKASYGRCVEVGGGDTTPLCSHVVLERCQLIGSKSSATDSGNIIGVGPPKGEGLIPAGPFNATVRDCLFDITTSGSGNAYHVDGSESGTLVVTSGCNIDAAKCILTGTSKVKTELRPASTARELVVDSAGLADANAVKVGPTGAGTAQTAGDLKGTLGTPAGASVSADIATKPTAAQFWAALTSGLSTSGSVGKLIVDNLDAEVSSITASGFDTTEKAQVLAALSIGEDSETPTSRRWVIKRQDGKMRAVAEVAKDVDEEDIEVEADFRNVLKPGDAIKTLANGGAEEIALIDDGNEGDQVESDAFETIDSTTVEIWMNSTIRFKISGGTAGQKDRIRVKARTEAGELLTAPCTVSVGDGT